ncbi:uncharacterized protein LOC131694999 [Topomyia yanbarensis]|uniref:uncharacterized protein LOC131694999 n=1 Tax=Topomyia yanbarensis TaxID=2498891 RepID=UPI00273BEB2E|nr:uncharacterized protein LOC131694999 [Topomyia yanbarensis]
MDSESIISEVFSHNILWDKTLKEYHNRVLVEKEWNTISKRLDVPKDLLKKRWKNLRDQFGKELKKIPQSKSGDPGPASLDNYSTWPYFKSMWFLQKQMKPRTCSGNLKDTTMDIADDAERNDFERYDTFETSTVAEEDMPDIPVPAKKGRKKLDHNEELINLEKRKLELLEKKAEKTRDEDEAFFDSLLPHVRMLQPANKLLCRMELQKVVLKHAYGNSTQPICTTPIYIQQDDFEASLQSADIALSQDRDAAPVDFSFICNDL